MSMPRPRSRLLPLIWSIYSVSWVTGITDRMQEQFFNILVLLALANVCTYKILSSWFSTLDTRSGGGLQLWRWWWESSCSFFRSCQSGAWLWKRETLDFNLILILTLDINDNYLPERKDRGMDGDLLILALYDHVRGVGTSLTHLKVS